MCGQSYFKKKTQTNNTERIYPTPPCRALQKLRSGPPRLTLPSAHQAAPAGLSQGPGAAPPGRRGGGRHSPSRRSRRGRDRGAAPPPGLAIVPPAPGTAGNDGRRSPGAAAKRGRTEERGGRRTLSVALPEDGVALCGAGAPEKRLGNPVRPFPGAAAEVRVSVRRAPVSAAPFAPCSPPLLPRQR